MPRHKTPSLTMLLADLACVAGALCIGGLHAHLVDGLGPLAHLGRLSLYMLVWVLLAERLGTYAVPLHRQANAVMRAAAETWVIAAGVAGLIDVTLLETPGTAVWRIVISGLLLLLIARLLLLRTPLGNAARARPRVLLIGAGNNAASLAAGRSARRELDLRGHLSFPGEPATKLPDLRLLGEFDDLERLLAEHQIDLVLVCPSDRTVTRDVHRVFQVCDRIGMSARFFPPFLDLRHLHAAMTWVDGHLGLELQSLPNRTLAMLCKRAIDFAGAAIGVTLLLPAFVFCALAVKLSSKGPILFAQIRVGKNGELFRCYKFRTMKVGAHQLQAQLQPSNIQDGPAFKIPNDPRLTPVGGMLRRYSLDELPQLFNVLLGDMSLVGPRPPIPSEVDRYTWWQRRRISVRPGLTCIWQVWGRNRVSFKRWVEMDLYYIDNWSLWLDIKLLAHTVRAVLRGTGM